MARLDTNRCAATIRTRRDEIVTRRQLFQPPSKSTFHRLSAMDDG
ncbi:hypothetical protein [Xanthobacter sp. KR7-225]